MEKQKLKGDWIEFDYLLGGIHRGFFPTFLALDVDGVHFFVTVHCRRRPFLAGKLSLELSVAGKLLLKAGVAGKLLLVLVLGKSSYIMCRCLSS